MTDDDENIPGFWLDTADDEPPLTLPAGETLKCYTDAELAARSAFALECAAEDFEVEQRAKSREDGSIHPWSEAVTFLAARAAALRST